MYGSSSRLSFDLLRGKCRSDGPEYACIRGEACDRDADVIIDTEHLLLVRCELSARALDTERGKVSDVVTMGRVCEGSTRRIAMLQARAPVIAGITGQDVAFLWHVP
jgi:hypothetical protein